MKDNLEQFIQNNREAFDDKKADDRIWRRIESDLPKKKTVVFTIVKYAAAAILLLVLGAVVGMNMHKGELSDRHFASKEEFQNYHETEKYYVRQVNAKFKELEKLRPVDQSLSEDMAQLDAVYQELKNELLNSNQKNNQDIINMMIQNYQTKIEILGKVLERTQHQDSLEQNLLKYETIEI